MWLPKLGFPSHPTWFFPTCSSAAFLNLEPCLMRYVRHQVCLLPIYRLTFQFSSFLGSWGCLAWRRVIFQGLDSSALYLWGGCKKRVWGFQHLPVMGRWVNTYVSTYVSQLFEAESSACLLRIFFHYENVRQWNKLPRKIVQPQSLWGLKIQLNKAINNPTVLNQLPCCLQAAELNYVPPTWIILQSYVFYI